MDDLFQVGCIGLIKAIDNFDPAQNVRFSTYGVPMIVGEVKRYLRDNNAVRVSRSIRDLAYHSMQAREELQKQNGREPKLSEIAARVGQSPENVAMALESAVTPTSLYEPVYSDGEDSFALLDQLRDATGEESWISDMMFRDTVRALTPRERRIIALRYLNGKTQTQVAKEIGISQAQVSRLGKGRAQPYTRNRSAIIDAQSLPPRGEAIQTKTDSPLSGLSVYIYSTSIPQAPSARVKDFGFLYKMPVIPRLYAAWALALLSSTKIDSS